jgi:hypothetical protein
MMGQTILNRWRTREALTTSADRTASTRGFLGDYELTITLSLPPV